MADRGPKVAKLVEWCREQSTHFAFNDQLVEFRAKPDGNIGAFAKVELAQDTVVVRVPSELMFGPKQIKRKYKPIYNEIESKVRRFTEAHNVFLGGPEAEEAPLTMALAFGLLLEVIDPASQWRVWWDALPEHVPSVFDLDGDFSYLEGSQWKRILEERQQHMKTILTTIVVPIIERIKPRLPVDNTAAAMERAYGILQTRQFKDDMHGKRMQYLFPVLDMIDGESERLSNVIVDDGPSSSPARLELVLKTSRKVEAGEELRQYYDSCANASYVMWYRFITDSMVFSNTSHRTFIATSVLGAPALDAIEASAVEDEVKTAKKVILHALLRVPPAETLELTHRQEALEEGAALVAAIARLATSTTAPAPLLKQFAEQVKTHAKSGADLVTAVNKLFRTSVASGMALATLDAILKGFRHGDSLTEDLAELDSPALSESNRLLLKVRISEKDLLIKFRGEVAALLGAPEGAAARPRLCDNCMTWRKLALCKHCGTTYYCSRPCQLRRLKEHKRNVPAAK